VQNLNIGLVLQETGQKQPEKARSKPEWRVLRQFLWFLLGVGAGLIVVVVAWTPRTCTDILLQAPDRIPSKVGL